ncbi:hypothetical protein PhCBS80983_g00294 [Powellomyces hirtus]|uniref:Protein kinase domain-containing protein n=1 Tax=Powellomyces hirtus TaxID=109895 RepID=A0A507EH74_9FUNG|nr:hypothetical protein PhCBS80983_g00294 [Powellomyces hirtus]
MPSKIWRKHAVEKAAAVKQNDAKRCASPESAHADSRCRAEHHEVNHDDDDDEDGHGAVFAFDTDERFDSVGSDTTSEDVDSDASSSTVLARLKRTNGPSKFNPVPNEPIIRIETVATPDRLASDDDASPSSIDSPLSRLRLSFAEPADVSQVLAIHDFTADTKDSVPVNALRPKKVGLSDFQVMSVIGKGAYGKVFLVRKKPTLMAIMGDDLYAMKVLKKASIVLHGKDAEHTRNERGILEDVSNHPFIVSLHYAFQTDEKLYLILSYASGGELFTYLAREKMFAEDVACFYIAELLLALEHLHDLGIIYRDLKPENVLLNADGHVLLTDFGLSKVALDARTVCGTIEFMAPEVLDDHRTEGYDKAVDYWSLGVMLFDMLTGSPPFTGNNRKKIMDGILKKKIVWPKYMTVNARDICNRLLQKNPVKRLGSGPEGALPVKKHNFFRKLDWKKLAALQVTPPLVPTLNDPADISHFDDCFTSMPMESPAELGVPIKSANNMTVDDPLHHFDGFSYVAESAYF